MSAYRTTPELAALIDAARDLAWRSHCNLSASVEYHERYEAHERLTRALRDVGYVSPSTPAEVLFLVAAIRRVATATFSNRCGLPYAERRQAVFELRGCLDVYDASMRVAA